MLIEVEGEAAALDAFVRAAGRGGAAARAGGARAHRGARADRRGRVRDPGEPPRRRARRARVRRRRHLRRLPARALRPRRPPPPLPVHQLHQLRPALHDRARTCPTTGRSPRWPASRMCARCRAEYDDPADRRFHAQPNACPDCGPALRLGDAAGRRRARGAAVDVLAAGGSLAVKGLGGYHLACRAEPGAGRGGAARAQAPGGPAVRPDGAVAGGGARAGGALGRGRAAAGQGGSARS